MYYILRSRDVALIIPLPDIRKEKKVSLLAFLRYIFLHLQNTQPHSFEYYKAIAKRSFYLLEA